MRRTNPECRRIRQGVVERYMSSPAGGLPAGIRTHIEKCGECRRYARGVQAAPGLFAKRELYNAALKAGTLAAIARSRTPVNKRIAFPGFIALALALLGSAGSQSFFLYSLFQAFAGTFSGDSNYEALCVIAVTSFVALTGFLCLIVLGLKFADQNQTEVWCERY